MNNPLIGIIAEDDSDVDCIKLLIRRLHQEKQIGFKKFVGRGCGKITRKANAWAKNFERSGCNHIILIHDLDKNNKEDLIINIQTAFLPSPIKKYIISVPVEELEAWLLSDDSAIKKVFKVKKPFTLPNSPESISSPKEFLENLVCKITDKQYMYLNTKHNSQITEIIKIDSIESKCPSFSDLYKFIMDIC